MIRKHLIQILMLGATLFLLWGCGGGGGGGGGGGAGSTAIVSSGVMTKGSVILNGVHYDDSGATVIGDNAAKTSAFLKTGMVVKMKGRRNSDGATGTAQLVKAVTEVRGTVTGANATTPPYSIVVIGQTVYLDDQTVFGNFTPGVNTALAAVNSLILNTDVVEVFGMRDATGAIHASRVELVTAAAMENELRGTVSGLTPGTSFTLQPGGINVDIGGATIMPSGATLSDGALVEVHGDFNGSTFVATRVDLEDVEDAEFHHGDGEEFELEGFVSGCVNTPCGTDTFTVNGQQIRTDGSTHYENGTVDDLVNGVKIEAEGQTFDGTTLIAEKIKFKRVRVILTGTVSAVTPTSLSIFGQTVQIDGLTDQSHTNAGITNGERVEVRGFVSSGGQIVAQRLDDSPGGNGKDIVQAQVTAESGNVLTMLGVQVDVTGATFDNDNDSQPATPMTLAQFLAAVVPAPSPGGTLVKVRGSFDGTTLIAEEAELED